MAYAGNQVLFDRTTTAGAEYIGMADGGIGEDQAYWTIKK